MALSIAVAGKGGTGKTTLAGMIVRTLIDRGEIPVLAVDADPNANLNVALGMDVEKTIGELREDLLERIRDLPPGMTKDTYLELGIQECLCEGGGVDLLVMGPGEGQHCYCAVNHVLRRYMDRLQDSYPYVVMDNEAGLEHLSRTTTQDVDVLLVTSTDTPVALRSAARIGELVDRLDLRVGKRYLVINHLHGIEAERVRELVENGEVGLELLGSIPRDEGILNASWQGESLMALPEDASALAAVGEMLDRILHEVSITGVPDGRRGQA